MAKRETSEPTIRDQDERFGSVASDAARALRTAANNLTPCRWGLTGREPRILTTRDIADARANIAAALARIDNLIPFDATGKDGGR